MYACVGGWCDLRSVTQATCSHMGGWCELRTVTQAMCTHVGGWCVLRNVTQATYTHVGGWCVLRTMTQATCTCVRHWWVLRNVTQTTCTHMGGWCVLRTGIATFSALSPTYLLGTSHLWITVNSSSGWGVTFITCPLVILCFLRQNNFIYSMKISHIQSMHFYHSLPLLPHIQPPLRLPLSLHSFLPTSWFFFLSLFSPKGILVVKEFPDMVEP